MRLEWILNPITVYAIASAGLLVALVLFVSMKREMAIARGMALRTDAAREEEQKVVQTLQAELASLRDSLRKLEEVPPARPAPVVGINLTKRAQALRMHRRGESIPSIAAALETPTNEVALLLKVHTLTVDLESKAS